MARVIADYWPVLMFLAVFLVVLIKDGDPWEL